MRIRLNVLLLLVIGILSGFGCGFLSLAQASTQVAFDQTLYFSDQEGMPIQLEPAGYEVSHSGGEQLILSEGDKKSFRIQARPGTHSETLSQPKAILVEDEDDSTVVWVMYLLPDGTGWESMGSTTGIQSRGRLRLSKRKRNFTRILRYRNRKKVSTSTPKPKPPIPQSVPVPADCPGVANYNIWYPTGVTDPKSVDGGPEIINDFVSEILRSYQAGCWPIRSIIVLGYSDKSVGGIQVDDYISVERAIKVKEVLKEEFVRRSQGMTIPSGYPSPAKMSFYVGGIGSRKMGPNDSPQDQNHRRVELLSYALPATVELGMDRPGGDYEQKTVTNAMTCRSICASSLNCRAFTYKNPVPPQSEGTCFLKNRVNRPTRDSRAISGVVMPAPQ